MHMNVLLDLIDEADRKVPATAPFGTRWKGLCKLTTAHGAHSVAVAARIDARGRRREQFWCDEVRVERSVLLRLTCAETECPHAIEVRVQWLAFHRRGPAHAPRATLGPQPLTADIPVTVAGRHHVVARPARFPCFTPCPHGAHPPLAIDKTGFDLFEEGVCLGGGIVEHGGMRRPRIPTVHAAEAFVLARHLEALAALGQAADSSRADPGPTRHTG
jgi:hypothetical protein